MPIDRTERPTRIGRDTARSVSKLLLAAGSLVFLLYLLSLLPGIDRLIPRTPVTFAALVATVVTGTIVVLLLYSAPKLASLVRYVLDGPTLIVENLASVAYWLVVLAAVLVAHPGFAGAAMPFVDDLAWLYDVAFLVVALPPVAIVAYRLYVSLDPGAELLAETVVHGNDTGRVDDASDGAH